MKTFINGISIFRILSAFALLPLVFFQLWGAALILFLLAAASDYLDGVLARRFHATSKLGGVLDHMGDKMLMTIAMIITMLAVQTPLVIVMVSIAICRDLYVSGLREFMGSQKMDLPVDKGGKIKTVAQMISLMIFFLFFYLYMNDLLIDWHGIILDSALATLAIATLMTAWSAARYTLSAMKKIKK
ncbi:MAG: CDP-alcohol phosphatidyltransferase family protein [Alphaproteobacteria bacterium]|nr:CDP-alcohol phosphatidyltransferase family protein [Alphaproteobacteria bacterium]